MPTMPQFAMASSHDVLKPNETSSPQNHALTPTEKRYKELWDQRPESVIWAFESMDKDGWKEWNNLDTSLKIVLLLEKNAEARENEKTVERVAKEVKRDLKKIRESEEKNQSSKKRKREWFV